MERVKTAIRVAMMENDEVAGELQNALRKALDSDATKIEKRAVVDDVEGYKQHVRQELQMLADKFNTTVPEEAAEERLKIRFGAALQDRVTWECLDHEGSVYGWPESVKVVTVRSEGETFLLHRGTPFDKAELALLLRLQAFYENQTGCSPPPKLVGLGCSIAPNTRAVAEQQGVELIDVIQFSR